MPTGSDSAIRLRSDQVSLYSRQMRITLICKRLGLALLVACLALSAAQAQTTPNEPDPVVPQTWQMLDYLATDYAGAVRDGSVIDDAEYAEMREFAESSRDHLRALGAVSATPDLLHKADALVSAIAAKADAGDVSKQAHALADALLLAYPMAAAPEGIPDLSHGASLYQNACASCHGTAGRGDGPAGRSLQPPPIDFTDQQRADQRSVLSLYEVISQGVKGTAMPSYAQWPAADRWSLAYYVGSLAYTTEAARSDGAQASARASIANLQELSRARVAALEPVLGQVSAREVLGYLRAHPEAIRQAEQGIPLARARLSASVDAYRSGEKARARQLALSAYLDGVEPVEPQLNARDPALRGQIESEMGLYRSALSRGTAVDAVAAQALKIDAVLGRAERVVADSAGDATTTFIGSFTILVREGLEALLIVVALLAFLRKAQRPEATRYVHLGWIGALIAGAITWAVASYAISISGAGRELTEGLSALTAAAILLVVGLWMHQKSIGGRWQIYLKEKMSAALNRRSAWFLFGLAFISVYREVFESILFYAALWNAGQAIWLFAGIAAGAAVLSLLTWVMLRTSRRLPLGKFFLASSALIAVLAVVLAGKGIAALQEAGWIDVTAAPVPRVDVLGVFPTWESLGAQAIVISVLALGFVFNRYRARAPVAGNPAVP